MGPALCFCSIVCLALHICKDTAKYYAVFLSFFIFNSSVQHPLVTMILDGNKVSAVHLFTLSKQLLLWDAPHYRTNSFSADLRNNLQNVAIPGTGIPLSSVCYSRWTALLFVLFVNPIVSLAAAFYLVYWLGPVPAQSGPASRQNTTISQGQTRQAYTSVAEAYHELLLCPQHWFAVWRHNCLVVGYHALVTGSSSYRLEDKGVFLLEGDHLGLPVSPYYKDAAVFVKHKSVEGGMGIHVYKNFAQGGDWIIQKALSNSLALDKLLPEGAPLSTFRVVTASTSWLGQQRSISHQLSQQQSPLAQDQGLHAALVNLSDSVAQPEGKVAQAGLHSRDKAAQRTEMAQVERIEVQSQYVRAPTPPLPLSRAVLSPQKASKQLNGSYVTAKADTATPAYDSLEAADAAGSYEAGSQQEQQPGYQPLKQSPQSEPATASPQTRSDPNSTNCQHPSEHVQVVTAVWRAGLAGADTDHASVCFNLAVDSGTLGPGVGANHWYKLGLSGLTALSKAHHQEQLIHPQSGKQVAGVVIPETPDILATVVQAHMIAAPDVPLIGWDIAVTPDGVFLLEINISCNLFNGRYDQHGYYEVLYRYLAELGVVEARQAVQHHGSRCEIHT